MKAEESKLSQVLTDGKIYKIPLYQRPYSWNEKHTQDLINDTYEAFQENQQEYFIGTIISIEKERDTRYDIVDGQQRLTTLTLMFSKLRDLIEDSAAKKVMQDRIMPVNVLTGEAEKPRLNIRLQDQRFFEKHILAVDKPEIPAELSEPQRNLINNSKEIESYLKDKSQNELKLYANYLLNNVYIVFVNTQSFASAYRLFNVLNARGLSLSNGDLLKNRLYELAGTNASSQGIIEDTWQELEEIITIANLDNFLGHFRTSIKGSKAQDDLFKEYEQILIGKDVDDFCSELIKAANNYKKIVTNDFPVTLKIYVSSLKRVSYDEWIPPVLAFLNSSDHNIDDKDFFELIEKITYQNWIRRLGGTKRNTVYYNVINDINSNRSKEDLFDTFKKHANNKEFIEVLNGDLYGMSYAKAVLLGIENTMQDSSVVKDYTGLISIEHILPQSIKDSYWTDRFDSEKHKMLVHRIGNLTLLSGKKNTKAQNYSFPKKKEIYNNLDKKVSFDLTKEVCSNSDWTEEKIYERQEKIIKHLREMWEIK
jgi:uncharacterized protein with ParB-like and HNH nuclease domain